MDGWSDFLTGPRLGDPEGILVGNFVTPPPGWENQKDFLLEKVKVKRLVKQMGMWLGGPKEDAPWSNGQVRAW